MAINFLNNGYFAGNVGIGTASPTDKLDVAGAIRLTSNISFDSNKAGRIYKSSQHGLAIQGVTGSENNFAMFTPSGALKIVVPTGTNNLVLNPTNGNVGIGTTIPDAKLHVELNSSGATPISQQQLILENNTATGIAILTPSTTSGYLFFGDNNDAQRGYIAYAHASDEMKFKVAGSERMVIDSSGNVGIGTTSPGGKLDIAYTGTGGTGTFGIGEGLNISSLSPNITFNDNSTGIDDYAIHLNQSVFTLGRYTSSTSQSPDLVLKSGNVGIGTGSPQSGYKLHLKSTTHTKQLIETSADSTYSILQLHNSFDDTYGTFSLSPSGKLHIGNEATGVSDNLVIDSGNVGIGTASPSAKLEVKNSTVSSYSLRFTASDDGDMGGWYQDASNNSELFLKDGGSSTKVVINSSGDSYFNGGNVGIGTDNPGQKLDVTGNIAANSIYLYDSTSNDRNVLDLDGSDNLQISTGTSTGSRAITLFTEGSEKMRISSTGNVGINITNPSAKLHVNGSSIIQLPGSSNYFKIEGDVDGNLFYAKNDSIGIGTTSPGYKLDVYGQGFFNSGIITNTAVAVKLKQAAGTLNDATEFRVGGGEFKMYSGRDSGLHQAFVFATGDNYTSGSERMRITSAGAIKFNAYDSANNTGTPTYLLGTDASGNVVKTLSTPSPITSQAASLYDLIPNGAFTTTYAFTSTAGTYAEVMSGNDVITETGTYSIQMLVNDFAVGGTQYDEKYSGVMTWHKTSTNDANVGAISEIALHRAGHAGNQGITYLRTRETTSADNNELKLEIMSNKTYTSASNVVFKFVRLI